MADAPAAVEKLVDVLDVEQLDLDLFRSPKPAMADGGGPNGEGGLRQRLFGGEVAGQSLRAAERTVTDDRRVHSLHCYFLRPGNPSQRLYFYVDRSRDGRSFTTRHVAARQGGETIFEMMASFHVAEEGDDYVLPRASVPGPGDLPPSAPGSIGGVDFGAAFDVVDVGPDPDATARLERSTLRYWVRASAPLPDDAGIHAAMLAYMSDMRAGSAAMHVLDLAPGSPLLQIASVDHAMWFHRPVRADAWLLMDMRPVAIARSRALVIGTMHDEDGVHAVTFNQELLLRHR